MGESLASLAAVEHDVPLMPPLPPLPTNSSNVVCRAKTPPVVAAGGASAPKKMMTSKDANSMVQKNPNKTKAAGHAKTSAPKKKILSKAKIKRGSFYQYSSHSCCNI